MSPTSAPNLHVSSHPAVLHKLAILRDQATEPKKFREIVRELSWLLGYEALADARVRPLEVRTPIEPTQAHELGERIGLVPILRAGLGMVDGITQLIPSARVGHIGIYRDHDTLKPVEYYFKIPRDGDTRDFFVLDPMLATGGSAADAVATLKRAGAQRIRFLCLVACPEGTRRMNAEHPDVPVYAAALDRQLNEKGYILPGLGDAGDRLFGTR